MKIFQVISGAISVVGLLAGGIRVAGPDPVKLTYPAYFGNHIFVTADNPPTEQGIALGRMLFYEKSLSVNNKMSCATCHKQELAFTDGKQFSAGFDGTLQPRNTMSLANLLWVQHFFWDGRMTGLEKQAGIPLTNPHEMGQALDVSAKKLAAKKIYPTLFKMAFGSDTINGDRILKALAQFERTLISCNSRYDQYLNGTYQPTPAELNGLQLFFANPDPVKNIRGAACGHCHGGPKTFIELFHNNGLDSIPVDKGRETITGQWLDRGRFRVVTLRNIALTAPYMHDGRFNTLEEVVGHYNEHVAFSNTLSPFLQNISNKPDGQSLELTKTEQQDIIAFLRLLTDSTFITDKKFSDPFVKN